MSDSKQLGYAIMIFIGIMGIGLLILARGHLTSIFLGIIMVVIGFSPLIFSFIQSWKEIDENEANQER